jgi:hypothetical protein
LEKRKFKNNNKKYYYSKNNIYMKKKKEIPFFISKYKNKNNFNEELHNKDFRLFLYLKKRPFNKVKKG